LKSSINHETTIIQAETKKFSELFHEGRFIVPWHQRHYDWKRGNIEELLQDIDEAIKEESNCYFLGTIMLVESKDAGNKRCWEINDGQQRMVTISLMCASLCRHFNKQQPGSQREGFALRISFDLGPSSTSSLGEAAHYPVRIRPPQDDEMVYYQIVRGEQVGSNGNLVTAWNIIEKFFSDMSPKEQEKYFDFLINKVEVVRMHIPATIDINAVYETINCRGKQLDDFDLIRNHIYSFFRSNKEKERKQTIHERLEKVRTCLPRTENASEYMRCRLQCEFGFLRKESFYNDFKKSLQNGKNNQVKKSTTSLEDYIFKLTDQITSPKYLGLFHFMTASNPDPKLFSAFENHSGTKNSPRNLRVFLRELRDYKISQPLVFSMLMLYINEESNDEKKGIAKMVHRNLKRLTTFIMRTAFVTKFEPSKFEKEFSNYAWEIRTKSKIIDNEFLEFLKERDHSAEHRVLDDAEFKKLMTEARMTGKKKTCQFFLGINRHIQKDTPDRKENYTVEHILPESLQHWDGWDGFKDVDPKDWIDKIGNLTLLSENDNKAGAKYNYSFSQKKPAYKDSSLKITRDLSELAEWTPREIEKRQAKMAKQAVQVWKFE